MHIPALPNKLEHRQFLGAGGMGQVHLAYDRERGEEVCFKVLTSPMGTDDVEARFLFKQEYWAMASVRHPNLVQAYDYGELADGTPYLTMELVPGKDLSVKGPASEAEVRAWLPGIAAALGQLHAQGYVHGDLKPENVRLRDDGTAKLMDLGLLTRVGRPTGAIRGTLDYVAPELIRQGAPDGRADLYALGALLYHVLAGRPMFNEDSPIALLHAHLEMRPTPLGELRPDLTPALVDAVMRLIEKEPAARFPHVSALLEALGLRAAASGPVGLLGSAMVGRADQQEALRDLIAESRPAVLRIFGEAGSGKSRLLQEARAEALLSGLPALTVRGLGVNATPYQALRPLIVSLTEKMILASDDGHATVERLAPVLKSLMPEVSALLGVEAAPALEGAQERLRLQLAIAELVAASHEEALWLVDDWDQLDPASRDLLNVLRREGAQRPWRWAITESGVAELDAAGAVEMPPLTPDDILRLAQALLGQATLPAIIMDRLVALSGGMPGAIEAVLGHWLRSGALRPAAMGWQAGPDDSFDLPGGLRVALDAGFEALDERAKQLARAAAILGTQGELPLLAEVAEGDEAGFFAALQALEAADVLAIEARATGRAFRFLRPAQVPALVATLPEERRRALHGRAARWLAARHMDGPDAATVPLSDKIDVARHHLAGDTPLAALPWVLHGVRRALAMFELDAAAALIDGALALDGLKEGERLELEVFAANKLRYQGRTDDALAFYRDQDLLARLERAGHAELAQETVTVAVLQYLKTQYDAAKADFERAIALADLAGQAAPAARALTFLGRLAYFQGDAQASRGYLEGALERARTSGLTSQLASALGFFGYVLASTDPSRATEGLAMLDESIALNQEIGDPTEANESLDLQGNLYLAANRLVEARRAFQEVLANADRLGMDLDAVMARLNLGAVMLELGEFDDAMASARLAHDSAVRQGRKFPQGYALALEGAALVPMGRPAAGAERLQRGLSLAREIGNRYLELNVLALWAPTLVALGRFDEAGEALALARQLARQTQNLDLAAKFDLVATSLAVMEVPSDATPAALQEVGDRLRRLEQSARLSGQPVALAQALHLSAVWDMRQSRHSDATRAGEEALAIARAQGLRGLEAEVGRLLGLAALAQGRPADARRFLEASRVLAESLGAHPLALLDDHALGGLNHDARRRRDAARALRALNDLPGELAAYYDRLPDRAEVLAAADPAGDEAVSARARDLLDWLAAIDRADVLGDILELAVRALVQLTDAERGFLLLFDGIEVTHQAFYGMSSADSDEYSTGLAYEVLYSGEPMILEDVQSDMTLGVRASVQALALRAVVGVPLSVDGQAIGTILADSRSVSIGFGDGLRELVVPLADHVARAVARAREREWQRRSLSEHALLFDLALATVGKHRLEEFLAPISAAALELTAAQQFYLLVGSELTCRAAFDMQGQPIPAEARELSQSVCRWVFDRGEPLYLADAQASEAFQRQQSVLALGLRAIHAVPVEHDGRQLGVLYVQSRQLGAEDPAALRTLMRMGELIGAFLASHGVASAT